MTESKPKKPFERSHATRMFETHVAAHLEKHQLSQRSMAAELGYSAAVTLNQMVSGRIPIPIDRAEEFADVFEIPKAAFLRAVLEQRYPGTNFDLLSRSGPKSDNAATLDWRDLATLEEFESIARKKLHQLEPSTREVLKEVLAAGSPKERWLNINELGAFEMLRRAFPDLSKNGLDPKEMRNLERALPNRSAKFTVPDAYKKHGF